MRASRLLSILMLLQTQGRLTARQLADELEVSVRTVYRDVESLSTAGVPLYGEPGHDGGYRLVDGYRTRLTGLTGDEAEALFLSGLPGPAAELGLGAVLATAQLKVMAALPDGLRDRAGALRQRFHLDTSGWYADSTPTPHLAAVVDGVWRQRQIQIGYRRWAAPQEVTRSLQPYGVVCKSGRWYLVAGATAAGTTAAGTTAAGTTAAGTTGSIRTYRVSQILWIEVLESGFDRPEAFDLTAHWRSYLAEFDGRRHVGEADVRLSPGMLKRLPDLVEPVVARAARDSAGQPDSDGWFRVTIPIESVDNAAEVLLRLGAEAEVLAPVELRERVAQIVTALAATYRSHPAR